MRFESAKRENISLAAKIGPAWRSTNFIDGTNLNEPAALGAFDLNWKVAENIRLTSNTNLIVQNSNSTLVSQNGATSKVADKISVRLTHTVEYNSDPPLGSVTTDMLSRLTLIYDF